MKQIILIRHARVDIDNSKKIDSLALQKWIELYDSAPIARESLPSKETKDLVQKADIVVTSTLQRAKDSAMVLGVKIYSQNALFNEAFIPQIALPYLKLKPKSWLLILRLMLLFGFGKKETSLKASKLQAKKAATELEILTKEHNKVVLVGHGGMNWLIQNVLKKRGWKLRKKVSHSNWGVTILEYDYYAPIK